MPKKTFPVPCWASLCPYRGRHLVRHLEAGPQGALVECQSALQEFVVSTPLPQDEVLKLLPLQVEWQEPGSFLVGRQP